MTRYRGLLCNVCGEKDAVSFSVTTHAAVRIGPGPKTKGTSATIGKLDVCERCFDRVIEHAPSFPDLAAVAAWKASKQDNLRGGQSDPAE